MIHRPTHVNSVAKNRKERSFLGISGAALLAAAREGREKIVKWIMEHNYLKTIMKKEASMANKAANKNEHKNILEYFKKSD